MDATLKLISELPAHMQYIFPYSSFNIIQSRIFNTIMHSNENAMIAAPTGSGKTVAFELAILCLFRNQPALSAVKAIFIGPLRSLCRERFVDWSNKFERLGLKCVQLTEVHLLSSSRGACLEGLVTRCKMMGRLKRREHVNVPCTKMRIIALSATAPNAKDVATWIDGTLFEFGSEYRAIPLQYNVLGFRNDSKSQFLFDNHLNFKLFQVIRTYSAAKPTLIFCSSRKGCIQAANQILTEADTQNFSFVFSTDQRQRLQIAAQSIKTKGVANCVLNGVGKYFLITFVRFFPVLFYLVFSSLVLAKKICIQAYIPLD